MIVILKDNCRIVGFTPIVWQAIASERPPREPRTLARTATLQAAFEAALSQGMVEPGKPLDLSGFNSISVTPPGAFTGPTPSACQTATRRSWRPTRVWPAARSGSYRVTRDAAASTPCASHRPPTWRACSPPPCGTRPSANARRSPPRKSDHNLTGIAHGLLDGATAGSGMASNEGAQTR